VASGGFDSTLRLWSLDGAPRHPPLEAHYNNVFSVAFSCDGSRIATAGWDDAVRIWKGGAREVELPRADEERITTVAVAAGAPVLAAAYESGGVQLWNLDASPHGAPLAVGSSGIVHALTFSREDVLASGSNHGAIRLWNLDGRPRDGSIMFDSSALLYSKVTLAFSPDGKALAVGATPFQLWNQSKLLWKQPLRRADSISSIAFSPRGELIVTGSALGDIQVWNSDGSSRAGPVKQRWEHVSALALAPAADYVAAAIGIDPTIALVNIDGSPRGALAGHFGQVRALAFSPTGRLVSGGDDGIVRFWTLPSGDVETIDVGLPINQLGFRGDELWVRANGETVLFYAPNRMLLATLLLRRDAALVYTAGGWYAGSDRFAVRLYDAAGAALGAAQAGRHMAPERVLQELAWAQRG
jgi:WD40 repeat protein